MPYSKYKLLIVDDSRVMRKIIKNHLTEIGFMSFEEAPNGQEALAILEKSKIDIILSDWCMTPMHGIEFLKEVRARKDSAAIPFIMVTAEAQHDYMIEAFKNKVTRYVVKPFTKEILKEHIDKVIPLIG